MNVLSRYRELYACEQDGNEKLIAMIESVPEANRTDPRFQQAVNLAAHLAACRENWLDRIEVGGHQQTAWFESKAALPTLRPRFAAIEARWGAFLAGLTEAELERVFEFTTSEGQPFRWYVEGQILQLIGHASYHRGQIALLVDQLGGETVDTDYLFWAYDRDPRFGAR